MSKSLRAASGPCPSFFRAQCRTARDGSTGGYRWAGHSLISAVAGLSPDDIEQGEWDGRVQALQSLIAVRNDGAVLGWLDRELPRCMALVPRPRRHSFLRGIYLAAIDEGLDITVY